MKNIGPSKQYGIVDLFAGPGGLAEGFSAFSDNGEHPFQVRLSVEKDRAAHRTLLLRTFLREFEGGFPETYYSWLNGRGDEPDWARLHPEPWRQANHIAVCRELGHKADQRHIDRQVDAIQREFGDNTILIGGPPCQAYSLVGRARNAGIADYEAKNDPRHFLYRAYIATLRRLKPAAFVMENVKGLLSSKVDGVAVFERVLEDLKAEGYRLVALSAQRKGLFDADGKEPEAKDFVIRAEEHGLPQARHRVIVVGIRRDLETLSNDDIRLRSSGYSTTVRNVLTGLPAVRSGLSGKLDGAEPWADVVANALEELASVRLAGAAARQLAYDEAVSRTRLAFQRRNEPLARMSAEAAPLPGDCPEPLARWLRDPKLAVTLNHDTRGHMKSDLGRYLFAALFAEATGRSPKASEFPSILAPEHANWRTGKFADRFRVQTWDAPATTVVSHISKDGHYFIHPDPTQCRSLTVREAARLQTFPDNYLFLGNRTDQYVQVGNAVPPLLAYRIASTLWQVLNRRIMAKFSAVGNIDLGGRVGTRTYRLVCNTKTGLTLERYILEPEASKLIESMRDIGYSLETALADIIDNSISASATKIEVLSRTSGEQPVIAVLDDGVGMTRDGALTAMRPGSRNPAVDNRPHDLGRFGLGLKTASFSQARRLSVVTRRSGEFTCAIWDLDHVAQTNRWEVLLPENTVCVPFAESLVGEGTLVVWEKPDRVATTGHEKSGGSIGVALDEAREHLELVFHRFLAGEPGQRKISMKLNGRALKPFDPFHSDHAATQRDPQEPEILRLRGEEVQIQAFTLPHHRKVGKDEWERYAGKAGYTKNQGFYVYRERRLIIHGTWFGLARQSEATKLARVRIDTPRELDQYWKIDVKKASAQLPQELRDHLRTLVERIGATSKRVYTHRGRILANDTRLPVWNRVRQGGEIRYRLNFEHPVLSRLLGDVDGDIALRLRHALELTAAALPIDTLIVDLSGKPEEVAGAEISEDGLRDTAVTTYRQLTTSFDMPDTRVLDMMSVIDPFRTRFPEVRAHLADEFGWVTA